MKRNFIFIKKTQLFTIFFLSELRFALKIIKQLVTIRFFDNTGKRDGFDVETIRFAR